MANYPYTRLLISLTWIMPMQPYACYSYLDAYPNSFSMGVTSTIYPHPIHACTTVSLSLGNFALCHTWNDASTSYHSLHPGCRYILLCFIDAFSKVIHYSVPNFPIENNSAMNLITNTQLHIYIKFSRMA